MLKDAAKEGSCCLVATHNKEVIQHAHRIVAMLDGRVEDHVEKEPAEAPTDDSIWAPPRDQRYYSPRT
jgi:ABC-type bacteriocin/lantibiotic exporter with double-glycine peptidase domain